MRDPVISALSATFELCSKLEISFCELLQSLKIERYFNKIYECFDLFCKIRDWKFLGWALLREYNFGNHILEFLLRVEV